MGIFHLRKIEKANSVALVQNKTKNDIPTISKEVEQLLWFADGRRQNIDASQCEPSAITTTSVISKPEDEYSVAKPPYYPSYQKLSAEQKWMYWNCLSKIYSTDNDIGYIFLFYYGLERHLLYGDFEKAFDLILSLRRIYDNDSFQDYSNSALLFSSIEKKRADYGIKYLNSLTNENKYSMNPNIFFFVKAAFNVNVDIEDILQYYRFFSFKNDRYIKSNYDLFYKYLMSEIEKQFGSLTFKISQELDENEWQNLKAIEVPCFANYSLHQTSTAIPDFLSTKWSGKVLESLQNAHESVKKELRLKRKNTQ